MKLEGLKVNFLGDSITEGVGTSSPEHIYLNLLKEQFHFAAARNYGISGARFAEQAPGTYENGDADTNYCKRALLMDDDADLVVVFGGTNDFGHGTAPFGTFADRTRATFCGACHELFSSLIRKYPDAVIVVLTPTHRSNEEEPFGDCRTNQPAVLREYVEMIRKTAEYYSLPVLDLYAMSGIQPRIAENGTRYMPDGLHPSDAGNALIAQRLAGFLLSL